MASLKWSRRRGWFALVAAAACTLALLTLISTTVIQTEKGLWAGLLLLILGASASAAALFSTDAAPTSSRHWTAWLQPRPIAILFLAIFAGFATMTDALALFEPRPAVESRAGAIEEALKTVVAQTTPKAARPARIRERLPGIWGEPGCRVSYRFAIRDDALVAQWDRPPPDAGPWRLVATITKAEDDVIEVRGEEPAEARGRAATFTYVTNGVTERLIWDDQGSHVPLELDRC